MSEEDNNILDDLRNEQLSQEKLRSENIAINTALAGSQFQNMHESNLIEYQLETRELLSNMEHFLRGEYITTDDEGNEFWARPTDDDLIILNDYGISTIMSIIGSYIDKGTALSTYDAERINEILGDLGDELAVWIFCNYEKIGMNTDYKKTRYPLLVLNVLHIIESAYRKAIGGDMRVDLNTAKIFTQSDFVGRLPTSPTNATSKKKFSLVNPSTWH